MENENLKVNANSSVLEHKRKHNLLVDGLPTIINEKMEQGETMEGYSYVRNASGGFTFEPIYGSVVKNGNKITFVIACNITKTDASAITCELGQFIVPDNIFDKLYPTQIGTYEFIDVRELQCSQNEGLHKFVNGYVEKKEASVKFVFDDTIGDKLTLNTKYYLRYELTLLLSDNLIPEPETEQETEEQGE